MALFKNLLGGGSAPLDLDARIDLVHQEAAEGRIRSGPRSRSSHIATRSTVSLNPGLEFYQAREYQPGDEARMIMGLKSAATEDQVFTKITHPETQIRVYALFDVSRTLDFGFSRESKLWLMARCAATLCYSLRSTQDYLMPVLYANNHIVWNTPRPMAPMKVSRQLCGQILEPVPSSGRLDSGLGAALDLVPKRGKSEIIIASDFLNLTPQQAKDLENLASNNHVRAIVIQDERERHLPEAPWYWPFPAPLRVFDLSSGHQYTWWLTKHNRERYTKEFEAHEKRLFRFFDNANIRYETVNTNAGLASVQKVLELLTLPPLTR